MITYSLLASLLLAGCLFACLQRSGRTLQPQEIPQDRTDDNQRLR